MTSKGEAKILRANEEHRANEESTESNEDKTVMEMVDDSIHSRDEPLGKQAPSGPFALVGLTYMVLLVVIILFVAYFFFM